MPTSESAEAALSLINRDRSKILGLTVGGHKIEKPGQYVPKADAQSPPQLSHNLPPGTYIIIALDPDAPLPSLPFLSPILHWIQPGLSSERANDETSILTSSEVPFVANYIPPGPPPIGGAHRYLFMLYEQPAGFDVSEFAPPGGKKVGSAARMRYSQKIAEFEKKAGLGPLIAANFFTSN